MARTRGKMMMPSREEEEKQRERGEAREAKFRRAKVKPGLDMRPSPLRSARPYNINIRETADAPHDVTRERAREGKTLGNVIRDRGSRKREHDGERLRNRR